MPHRINHQHTWAPNLFNYPTWQVHPLVHSSIILVQYLSLGIPGVPFCCSIYQTHPKIIPWSAQLDSICLQVAQWLQFKKHCQSVKHNLQYIICVFSALITDIYQAQSCRRFSLPFKIFKPPNLLSLHIVSQPVKSSPAPIFPHVQYPEEPQYSAGVLRVHFKC